MNKRKKIFFLIGIIATVSLIAVITFCVIAFQKKNQLQLTIGTHQISSEEYLACMQSVMYDTKMQIQQQYDVDYDDDFWKKKYGKNTDMKILAENILRSLKYIHAVYESQLRKTGM